MFAEYGLPTPYDTYETTDFLGPEWEQGANAFQAQATELDAMRQALREQQTNQRTYKQAFNRQLDRIEDERMRGMITQGAQAGMGGPGAPTPQEPGNWQPGIGVPPAVSGDAEGWAPGIGVPPTVSGDDSNWQPGIGLPPAVSGNDRGWQPGIGKPTANYQAPGSQAVSELETETPPAMPWDPREYANMSPGDQYQQIMRGYAAGPSTSSGRSFRASQAETAAMRDQYLQAKQALGQQRSQLYGPEYATAMAQAYNLQSAQRTPYTDALMQRRMVPMAAGLQSYGYYPGQGQ